MASNFGGHSPEGTDDGDDEASAAEVSTPPLVALARRHRRIIGVAVALIMLGTLVWALMTLPEASAPGVFGIVQLYSFPLICLLIAVVALTWGWKVRTLWVNIAAYATIATYLIYLVTGWLYENVIAA